MTPPLFAKASIPMLQHLAVLLLILLALTTRLYAQAGVVSKSLLVPGSPEATTQLSVIAGGQAAATIRPNGVDVAIKAGEDPLSRDYHRTRSVLPAWLGTKPPVEGDWGQTMDKEFAGDSINLHPWNVHPDGNWSDRHAPRLERLAERPARTGRLDAGKRHRSLELGSDAGVSAPVVQDAGLEVCAADLGNWDDWQRLLPSNWKTRRSTARRREKSAACWRRRIFWGTCRKSTSLASHRSYGTHGTDA